MNQDQLFGLPTWNTIYLIRQLGLGLIKQGFEEGLINIVTPETESEAGQIKDLKKSIENCECGKEALKFILMFDKVLVDSDVICHNKLYRSLDSEDYDDSRPIIESIGNKISGLFDFTDSSMDGLLVAQKSLDAYGEFREDEFISSKMRIDIANNLSLLEPMVWDGWCQGGKIEPEISRLLLRDILDLIIFNPEVLWFVRNTPVDSDEWNDPNWWREPLDPLIKKYNWDDYGILELRRLIYLTEVKGRVALHYSKKASNEKAIMPVWKFPIGPSRNPDELIRLRTPQKEDILVAIHLFLEEVEFLPKIETFSDLIKIKAKSAFRDFQQLLAEWTVAILIGDMKRESQIRKEIRSANRSLNTAYKCEKVGGWLTYFTIPLMIAEAAVLPGLGYISGIAGFGLKGVADWLKHENKWLILARGG